ncbi:MAG: diaminopimelate epimerase [Clostridia bacterium]|nr:diaminopimelate epimerase [Clostridia bacterium]
MRFTKMHGLGNDYLYVFGPVPPEIELLCKKLSDRHFGAGSDGMIYISESDFADFRMRIFNADGSEGKMCGNGVRCVGKYVYEKGYTDKRQLTVETLSGIKSLSLELDGKRVRAVTVEMGTAEVGKKKTLKTESGVFRCVPVSVGNPHAVIFTEDAEAVPLAEVGPRIERHRAFPDRINAEFVQVLGPQTLRMRVWERGSGITMACGTGACASAAAAVAVGLCRAGAPITVRLDGGDLCITVSEDGKVRMTGPAEFVYEGETIE